MESIHYTDPDNRKRLIDINLRVRAGEIVGIAGVEGNGQHELVNVIMGLLQPQIGKVLALGEDVTNAAILEKRKRIAYVSQDRANMGACITATDI